MYALQLNTGRTCVHDIVKQQKVSLSWHFEWTGIHLVLLLMMPALGFDTAK